MKKVLIFVFLISNISAVTYQKYGTKIQRDIKVDGYRAFDYVFWLHPGQSNNEIKTLFTKPVLDSLSQVIPQGSVVIDIGAHVGDTSVLYSLLVGDEGKVFAFEPNPSCFEVLKMNALNNPNIIPVNSAITEKDGKYTFHYTDLGLCNGAFVKNLTFNPYTIPVEVEGVNLENWLEKNAKELIEKIKFIKIDTEGYDKYIIENIKSFLIKYRPVIQTELYLYSTSEDKEELFNILKSLNYKIVIGAYEGLINTSVIESRREFDLHTFVNYPIPQGSIDLLCLPQ